MDLVMVLVNPSAVHPVREALPGVLVAGAFHNMREHHGIERLIVLRSWLAPLQHKRLKDAARDWFDSAVATSLADDVHAEYFDTVADVVHAATAPAVATCA